MSAIRTRTKCLISLLVLSLPMAWLPAANASVEFPMLNINTLGSDSGASSVSGSMTMDASAISILTSASTSVDIVNTPLLLSADYAGTTGTGEYLFNNGMLTIGSLLTATFDNLTIYGLPNNMANFQADLMYTGGDLTGNVTLGRIEGLLAGTTSSDFSVDFSANTIIATIGPVVVPLPGAIWLLGGGLIALGWVAARRRSKSGQEIQYSLGSAVAG